MHCAAGNYVFIGINIDFVKAFDRNKASSAVVCVRASYL